MAPPTAEVYDMLKAKHPPDKVNAIYPPAPSADDPTATTVTMEEVLRAITSFPNGSAAGLDGLRPQHLKDMVGHSAGEAAPRLLGCLARLLTVMLQGGVTADICPILYGAALTALRKKDGGIRPIAVGNVLRRLAGKIVSCRVIEAMGTLVRPAQLGYGTRGGAEAAVHSTRAFLGEMEETKVILKLDFRNAFNTVHRDAMLHAVRTHLPDYFRFVWQLYRHPSELSFGEFVLESASGVQQGDPLSPLLFCLVTRGLTRAMTSSLNAWYLDDATAGGSVEDAVSDLNLVVEKGKEVGLELNFAKCEAFVFGGDVESRAAATDLIRQAAPDMSFPSRQELSLLGSPLLPEGIADALEGKTAVIRLLTSRLEELHAHQALFLLKNCLSASKVMYVLRSSPAWTRTDKLMAFDEMIRSSLSAITNTDMTDAAWRQASLPVVKGGLGIRRTEEIALPAFLASVFSVAGLISTVVLEADLDDITAAPVQQWCLNTDQPAPTTLLNVQKQWDTPVVDKALAGLVAASSLRDKARLLATAAKESGYWLQALPSSSLGTFLDNDAIRISVAKRLGAAVCKPHNCRCGHAKVEEDGHHGLSCLKSAGRHSRHAALNDVIKRALVSASIPAKLEPAGTERDSDTRPDGMTMVPWKRGKALAWDVTCVDTMAQSYIVHSLSTVGYAANEAERRKVEKYWHLEENFIFSAVGFETFGPWGESAKKFIAEVGRRISEHTGETRATEFLRQRISIEIERGNAVSVLNTYEGGRPLYEIFNFLRTKH